MNTRLEDDVRQALRVHADALVVNDREFDPDRAGVIELPDFERPRRRPRVLLVAAVVVVLVVSAAVVARQTNASNAGGPVGGTRATLAVTTTTGAAPNGVTPERSQPAPAALVDQVASVPAGVLAAVGKGSGVALPVHLPGPVLTKDGKPRIVWIGAEYCPYCAAQRWPLIQALSRFGTFSDLRVTSSAISTGGGAPQVYPNTPTFSFHGSTYSSQYLAFDAVETETNVPTDCATPPEPKCSGYAPLDTPTPDEQALLRKYDAPPYVGAASTGGIPFIDFANASLISGSSYAPTVLAGRSRTDIANALSDPTTAIAKTIDGTANVITAQLCTLTSNQPATVCAAPTITSIQRELNPTP